MLNSITFIHFEDYMIINNIKVNIKVNIISLMNLFYNLINYILFKLAKTIN